MGCFCQYATILKITPIFSLCFLVYVVQKNDARMTVLGLIMRQRSLPEYRETLPKTLLITEMSMTNAKCPNSNITLNPNHNPSPPYLWCFGSVLRCVVVSRLTTSKTFGGRAPLDHLAELGLQRYRRFDATDGVKCPPDVRRADYKTLVH